MRAETSNTSNDVGRRSEILRRAAAVFAEKGFATATVRDIAGEVGILSGSLYHHFESKDAMVEELLASTFALLTERYEAAVLDGDPEGSLRNLFRAAFEIMSERPHELQILHNDYVYLRQMERFSFLEVYSAEVGKIWMYQLHLGQRSGIFRSDIDMGTAYRIMMGSILASVRWFRPGGKLTSAQLADEASEIFLSGLRVPAAGAKKPAARRRPART